MLQRQIERIDGDKTTVAFGQTTRFDNAIVLRELPNAKAVGLPSHRLGTFRGPSVLLHYSYLPP
ncbi:MAG: hypothetical protein DYG89_47020, partial [Caldilinea sp. CFX5]|nr:hypothetical protein [Caldilinea sp. CFX5]